MDELKSLGKSSIALNSQIDEIEEPLYLFLDNSVILK